MLAAVLVAMPAAPALAKRAPSPAPSATPTIPPEDPAVTQIARREFVAWQAGVVTASRYATQSQAGLAAERVTEVSKKLGEFGSLVKTEWVEPVIIDDAGGAKGYIYRMTCSNGVVYEQLIVGADGKIDGVVFRDKLPSPGASPQPTPP